MEATATTAAAEAAPRGAEAWRGILILGQTPVKRRRSVMPLEDRMNILQESDEGILAASFLTHHMLMFKALIVQLHSPVTCSFVFGTYCIISVNCSYEKIARDIVRLLQETELHGGPERGWCNLGCSSSVSCSRVLAPWVCGRRGQGRQWPAKPHGLRREICPRNPSESVMR
ncbi:uncharacterized protein LOC116532373 isoform X1 [Sapajus apella]|uniref:Uncharacterized protein LOC116532373 isoform X1 n=1 Tax=Sapajus apella TaxID=9515 RepID=A0A6J3FNZ4_SAPAP|nr:uncharacterized protein LOC116532373 isoform X1 [Sapajus apella]